DAVAISPDGSRIVSGSHDCTIRVWDADTGKPMGVLLQGHIRSIQSVAISPDGSHIVSGSDDTTIRVWDADTLSQLICFSPNSSHALSSTPLFLQASPTGSSPCILMQEWIAGPQKQLLLWIPTSLYPLRYAPGNTMVIPNDSALQLDLSCFVHGTSWHKCQHPRAA
ncbi:WD40 repeat-like protein, partial [Rhizopogon salebrosus TDB-379]